jgi:predicted PurR-regulated permease PerM
MATEEIQVDTVTSEPRLLNPVLPERPARRHHWAMNFIGIGTLIGLCYYGQLVLVVIIISVLLAFTLAPVTDLLQFLHIPRGLAALVAILLLIAAIAGIFYFSYNQAATLVQDLPKYSSRIREEMMRFRKRAESFEVLPPEHEKGVVNVRPATSWTDILTRGFGSVGTVVFAASFIPVLAYFMLTWQEHVRSATVMLFPMKDRNTAYVALGLISAMIRSFMVGNVLIGLLVGLVSTAVFGVAGVPFFYFAGFISGFLTLVPYLGIVLALVPPVFVGLGHLPFQNLLVILLTVFVLHVIALNVLYPKFLGNRLQLNPLGVTMGLLFWGALWGGVGLVLAIPITATIRIVFDHVEGLKPYGAWLGE